ncbi:hypothetical protein [Pseudalkalibacillus salsuginis]|uniref:hypothetical protein n=1 Tax=Pseudalkalibacillus salsuginis TaxID=2910972 RepID=UPI001F459B08|nr:hypothetical protein [Pseudalkalibacillus salsuginis]MCF6408461.1 hypothetical protein [Pseudalkalibacillus salsuginis]
MSIVFEKDIIEIVENDAWMIGYLYAVKQMILPDWWIAQDLSVQKFGTPYMNSTNGRNLADIDVLCFNSNYI